MYSQNLTRSLPPKVRRNEGRDNDPSGDVTSKAKRTNKKSVPAAAVEQQTMFIQAQDESTPLAQLPNKGTVLMDATCAPADVAYPTDLNLLNESREKLEAIIDTLHQPVIGKAAKPRTNREKARKQFLAVSKQRRPGSKVIRKAIRRQLGYVGRNLEIIAEQVKGQNPSRYLAAKRIVIFW
jgi:transposase, IS5 family